MISKTDYSSICYAKDSAASNEPLLLHKTVFQALLNLLIVISSTRPSKLKLYHNYTELGLKTNRKKNAHAAQLSEFV